MEADSLFDSSSNEEQLPILPLPLPGPRPQLRPCLADLIRREADPCLTAQEKGDVTKAIRDKRKMALQNCDLNHHELVSAIFAAIEFGKSIKFVRNVAASSFTCLKSLEDKYFDFRIMLNPDFVSEIGQSPAVASAHYGRIEMMAFFLLELPSLHKRIYVIPLSREARVQWEEYIETNPFWFDEQLLLDKSNALWEQQIRPILQTKVQNNQLSHDDVCRALVRCAKAKKEIVSLARFLVEEAGADILYKNDGLNHQTPLELACMSGHYDMTVYFLAQVGRCTDLLLHFCAAHSGNYRLARHLIETYQVDVSSVYPLEDNQEEKEMDSQSVRGSYEDSEKKDQEDTDFEFLNRAFDYSGKNVFYDSEKMHGRYDARLRYDTMLHTVFSYNDSVTLKQLQQLPGFMKFLLSQGAGRSLNSQNRAGRTPLIISMRRLCWAEYSYEPEVFEVMKQVLCLLLEAGAAVNIADEDGETPLHLACQNHDLLACFGFQEQVLRLLLEAGADVSSSDKDGLTPLHLVCRNHDVSAYSGFHKQALRLLLEAGADVNIPNEEGETPFHLACRKYDENGVALLLKHGPKVNCVDHNGETPLIKRMEWMRDNNKRSDPVFCMLLEMGADVNISCAGGTTPLHLASTYRFLNEVELLLKHGAQVNSVDDLRRTPLVCALESIVDFKNRSEAEPVIRILLEAGADVNISSLSYKSTPLHLACECFFVDGVDLLLKHEADVNAVDIYSQTPLICLMRNLCYASETAETIVCKLLEQGADVNVSKYNGTTPLHLACCRCFMHIIDLFLEHGAKVNAMDNQGQTPVMCLLKALGTSQITMECSEPTICKLLEAGADVNISCNDKTTVLHLACKLDFMNGVELLLKHGAQVNVVDADGNTPLLVSVRLFHLQVARRLLQEPDIQVNYTNDRSGHSALTLAMAKNYPCDFVHLLLDFGASITQTRWAWGVLVVASCTKTPEGLDKLFLLAKAFVMEQSAALNTPGNMKRKCFNKDN